MSLSDEMLALIAQSPTMMLAVGSGKAIEDILNKGIATADDLAETVDEAVEGWPSRIDIVARMFDDSRLSVDNAAKILNSARLAVSRAASILNDVNLASSRVKAIFDNANLSNARAKDIATELATNTAYTNYVNIGAAFSGARLLADDAYSILTSASVSADRAQGILYNWFTIIDDKLADILSRGASDASITAATTITGVNRYRNLSVASGVTLTVDGQPGVIIAYSVSNSGTIDKTKTGGAGGTPLSAAGAGGAGGGGLIIFTGSLANPGTIQALGAAGGAGAATSSTYGSGGAGGGGAFLRVAPDAAGSGGSGGYAGAGGVNGGTGGGVYNTYYGTVRGGGGSGDGSAYTGYADYPSLADDVRKAVIDWVLVNTWAKTPTATKALPNVKGSGGGAGGEDTGYGCGGGGGGGGGQVIILCVSLDNTGTISAGAGGGGSGGGPYGGGGGGGGGGIVYVLYKSYTNLGTLSAVGGAAGAGSPAGTAGAAGTAKAVAI